MTLKISKIEYLFFHRSNYRKTKRKSWVWLCSAQLVSLSFFLLSVRATLTKILGFQTENNWGVPPSPCTIHILGGKEGYFERLSYGSETSGMTSEGLEEMFYGDFWWWAERRVKRAQTWEWGPPSTPAEMLTHLLINPKMIQAAPMNQLNHLIINKQHNTPSASMFRLFFPIINWFFSEWP